MVQPVNDNILEELNRFSPPSSSSSHPPTHTSHPHMMDDVGLEGEGREVPSEPSPFSTKRDMYSGKVRYSVQKVPMSMYM